MNTNNYIQTVEEVAQYFQKSLSWVYKNWKLLGGKKLGGSLIFPAKEDLYEHVFCKKEGVEIRLHSKGNQAHECLVPNKERGTGSRGKKKGGNSKSETNDNDPNRHGLLGIGE
jgi:hypothetical protein